MPNKLACPRCGADTKVIYGPKGGYLRIRCSKPHLFVKTYSSKPDVETSKRNEVFIIQLDLGELELYRNNKLEIDKNDYDMHAVLKKGFKEESSN